MRNRALLVLITIFSAGCATSGAFKAVNPSENPNNIPPDVPEYFLQRYERFIPKDERKPIERINKQLQELTKKQAPDAEKAPLLAERDRLIAEFWAKRDTDPTTPVNEFKQIIDERIEDIAGERFFSTMQTPGLLFRNNDGFRGDVAMVYLLHSAPDVRSVLQHSQFVDLMLWIYMGDKEIHYAFLFYRQGSIGSMRLFPQDLYRINQCQAIAEIMSLRMSTGPGCTSEMIEAYQQLQRTSANDGTPGYVFAWALFNFSQDILLTQGQALQPPVPASQVAKQAPSRVVGEAPKPAEAVEYVLSEYGSMIPAKVSDFLVEINLQHLDWKKDHDQLECELKLRVVLESYAHAQVQSFERVNYISVPLESHKNSKTLTFYWMPADFDKIPPDRYRVSIYVKNTLTNKYFATVIPNFVKP